MEFDRAALLETFRAESEEGLALMESSLLALETRRDDPELIAEVFRVAHTLKGSARSLGLADPADFSHALEDLLDRVRAGEVPVTSRVVTLLLKACDMLRRLVEGALAGRRGIGRGERAMLGRIARLAQATAAPVAEAAAANPDDEAGRAPAPHLPAGSGEAPSLRVKLDRLNRMLGLTGEIAVARSRLTEVLSGHGSFGPETTDALSSLDRLLLDLQEQVMQARLVPLGPVLKQQVRAVRDLALERGKVVRVLVTGEEVEADTRVAEYLRDPLTHMVRNAVDHGLETPERRRAGGKEPCGTITLGAHNDAGYLVVQVTDDGEGIDARRVLARARRAGLLPPDETPSDPELLRLIFTPGFTTAEAVTSLSGRGVGLDVVRRNVEVLRGTVGVESRLGQGTTFTIRLPMTLLVVPGFLVTAAGETCVVPLDAVTECADLPAQARRDDAGEAGVVSFRGEALPYLRLRGLFGAAGDAPLRESLVVVQHEGGRTGLAVDQVVGEVQAVVRPLGKLFRGIEGFSGATVLGSGRVGLLLDVPGLVRAAARRHAGVAAPRREPAATARSRAEWRPGDGTDSGAGST
jgi:two-component system chemotaxis sensor kinase CheA